MTSAVRRFALGCLAVVVLSPLGRVSGADQASQSPASPPATESAAKAVPKKHPPRYEHRSKHDPDGIGKFYFGREIAHVMGYAGISWLERPDRENEEHLVQLVDSLKLTPGMVVADIGAGSGIISIQMASKVGPTGKVLAVDVQDEMINVLSKKLKQLKITNVKTVHGTDRSPNLKEASVDLAIMVDVYHEFRYPYEMAIEIAKALKPGGRVVFVEYRKEDPTVPIKLVHKMTEEQVKREIGQPEFGLKWIETIGVLPRQHIIVFERQPSSSPPASAR
jgi:precorrin-6B methylase 2